jgi:hypothetical protein
MVLISHKTAFFIVTAAKTSDLTGTFYFVYYQFTIEKQDLRTIYGEVEPGIFPFLIFFGSNESLNRKIYQILVTKFLKCMFPLPVRKAENLPLSVTQLSTQCGILNIGLHGHLRGYFYSLCLVY